MRKMIAFGTAVALAGGAVVGPRPSGALAKGLSPYMVLADAAPVDERKGKSLGIRFAAVPPGAGGPLRLSGDHGLVIVEVIPGGIAEAGGLKKGDVILAIDGKPVRSIADVAPAVSAAEPGHKITLQVSRDGVMQVFVLPL